jgi:hypothetical protein
MVPRGLNQLQRPDHAIGPADVVTRSLHLVRHIRRFGDYVLDLSPKPAATATPVMRPSRRGWWAVTVRLDWACVPTQIE